MNPLTKVSIAIAFALLFSESVALAEEGTSVCSGMPSIPGPVFISFDQTYTLYTSNMTSNPDGTYNFTRVDLSPMNVSSVCAEGFDLRAVPDTSVQGSYFPVAVEFHNAASDHYFLTIDAREIRDLDTGVHAGWKRTGAQFSTYVKDPTPKSGLFPLASVCRFYGLPAFGLDTHFFSAFVAECAAVGVNWPDRWDLETPDAFGAHVPGPSGDCPPDTIPVYRLFNNRPDVNHRYTTSPAICDRMIGEGWISEGSGAQGVAMCVRPS